MHDLQHEAENTGWAEEARGDSYDVAILGAGVGGSMLAAILARHGVRVLLIEADSHPRFTIGESTIPETAGLLRIIGERYSVPEITHLATFQSVRHHVSACCGVKRGFSFLYHREGEPQRPEESTQLPTLPPPFGPDVHWFRQDIDSYMFTAAVRYGATARQRLRIAKTERVNGMWLLASDKGERFVARYLVDAGGIRSPMAEAYGLRDNPPRQHTNSRSMFTHMVGVRPYDQCVPDAKAFGLCNPVYQGTLHHIFDGGWLWIIAFNNHVDSTNPLCSVGLTLDRRKHPETSVSAEEEFQAFLKRFPSIATQFKNARPVRDWVRSNARLQFSSRQTMGDGFCLLPHAAGFIDPLFSSGLAITVSFVGNLAGRLIRAKRENDFSLQRFAYLDAWVQSALTHFDRLVSGSYDSWSDFRLWNAWFRIWALGNFFGGLAPITVQMTYGKTGDPNHLRMIEDVPYGGIAGSKSPIYMQIFEAAFSQMEAFRAGQVTAGAAADGIFKVLRESDSIPPQLRLADPAHRGTVVLTLLPLLRNYIWGRFLAQKPVRETYYDTGFTPFIRVVNQLYFAELRRSIRTAAATTRDYLFPWNNEWRDKRYDPPQPARPVVLPTEDAPSARPVVVSTANRESLPVS